MSITLAHDLYVTSTVMMSPSVGLTTHELKPALLMLASCHTDLGKSARASDGAETAESREHSLRAQERFRQVYGPYVPPHQVDDNDAAAKFSMDTLADASTRQRGYLQDASNLAMCHSADDITLYEGYSSTSSSQGQIGILEREICVLRDRQKHFTHQLNDLHVSKRELEDELRSERDTRRHLERQLDSASQELSDAAEREKHASERCVCMESRMEELKQEVARLKREAEAKVQERDKKVRECFGKLGNLFLRAAKGEVKDSTMTAAFAHCGSAIPDEGVAES